MRKHIPLKVKLAAALLSLREYGSDGQWLPVIDHWHAKKMSADQIISLFQWDHYPVPHADGGPDEPWNLMPELIRSHREKTHKVDVPQIAKNKRIRRKQAEHDVRNAVRMQALVRLGEQRFQTDINNKMDQQLTIYAGKRKTVLHPGETVTVEPTRKGWSIKSRGFDKSRTKGFDGKVRVKAPR